MTQITYPTTATTSCRNELIVDFNNKGVHALLEGNDAMAIKWFAASLRSMKEGLIVNFQHDSSSSSSSSSPPPVESLPGAPPLLEDCDAVRPYRHANFTTIELPPVQNKNDDDAQVRSSTTSFFSNHVFFLFTTTTADHQEDNGDGVLLVQVYTSVIMFNLAVVYHRLAKKTGQTIYFTKSERLYSIAWELFDGIHDILRTEMTTTTTTITVDSNLQTTCSSSSSSSSSLSGIIIASMLAIANNLAEIRLNDDNFDGNIRYEFVHELQSYIISLFCKIDMADDATTITTSDPDGSTTTTGSLPLLLDHVIRQEPILERLLLNIMFLKKTTSSNMAPAA